MSAVLPMALSLGTVEHSEIIAYLPTFRMPVHVNPIFAHTC